MLDLCIVLSAALSGASEIDLAGAAVVCEARATDLERLAAREIARYFRLLSGRESRVLEAGRGRRREAPEGPAVLIGTTRSAGSRTLMLPEDLGEEGYVLRVTSAEPPRLLVGGRTPRASSTAPTGSSSGSASGSTWAATPCPSPAHAPPPGGPRRGPLPDLPDPGHPPWYNFLNSPTTWDLEDYQAFFDQMAKMGNNFVGFHSYDSEPFCAYPWEGAWRMGAPAATSLDYGWGALRGLKSDQFGFGTGRYFPYEVFGSRSTALAADPPAAGAPALFPRRSRSDEAILRAQAVLAGGLEYARRRGLHVCLGFELTGDPTVEENRRQAEARIRNLLATFRCSTTCGSGSPRGSAAARTRRPGLAPRPGGPEDAAGVRVPRERGPQSPRPSGWPSGSISRRPR